MNFKITAFKTIFSAVIGLLVAGLVSGYYNDCMSGSCTIRPVLYGSAAFILTFAAVYTLGSINKKRDT